jgi:hypothetical protein
MPGSDGKDATSVVQEDEEEGGGFGPARWMAEIDTACARAPWVLGVEKGGKFIETLARRC